MGNAWKLFRRFWTAEEVPRWFGLSILLVYLLSLGGVGYYGIREVRRDTADHYLGVSRYAVQALADRLRDVTQGADEPESRSQDVQCELRDFATSVTAVSVRVLDADRLIIASINMGEIGTVARAAHGNARPPRTVELLSREDSASGEIQQLLRAPLRPRVGQLSSASPPGESASTTHGRAEQSGSWPEELYVEAAVNPEPVGLATLVYHTTTLTVILVALGSLFALYRCLRTQLRSMSCIAGRLATHRNRIEESLEYLRIADSLDSVTGAWNELVELAQSFRATAQRHEAMEELTEVLKLSPGGALAEALNAVPDGLVYITDENRIEYLNSAACHIFGWRPAQAKSLTLKTAASTRVGEEALRVLRDAARPDGVFEARSEVVKSADEGTDDHTSFSVRVFPLHRANRAGECILMIRDVSQQIRAERAREEFVTQVTHELRTPLTNIRAYTETLSSGMFDDPSVVTECYNVITKETRRLSRLIEDILSVSQLEVGSIELQVDKVDLRTLLGDGVRDVRGLADEKSIDLQLILPAKMEPIDGDRDKLAVVVNNLLGNAIKYTMPEGSVFIGVQFADGEVSLTFKDNGIGVDEADRGRIFERFQRGSDPSVKAESGTGIGLFTAREIVRRHGGGIDLISSKGEGSTFIVRLPHRAGRAGALNTQEDA